MVKSSATAFLRQISYILVIVCVVALTFLPGLGGDFVNWDDTTHVLKNPPVVSFDIAAMFRQTVHKIYIPLTTLSFAIEYHFFGFDPFVFHLNNLLLHIFNSILVYVLAQRLGLSASAAFWTTLIFGIHPMKVESVAWVTERKDLLYAFLYLIAINLYVGYLKERSWRGYIGFLCFGVLSLLAKPMALSLPLIVFLLDWFHRRDFTMRTIAEKIPLVAAFIPITWITYALHVRNPVRDPLEAVLMWMWSFVFYIWKFLWPDPLVPVYPVVEPVRLGNPVYLTALVVFGTVCASLVMFSKKRWWIFSVGFYFLSIFFLFRFDPKTDIHVVADRFMYLPCLGFCFLFGAALDRMVKYFEMRNIYWWSSLKILLWLAVFMLALKSIEQTRIWNNSVTLWTHVIEHNPTAFLAYNDRAVAYIERGQYDLALADYGAILQFDPDNADAYYNRGLLLKKIGRYASAIDDLTQVIRRYPYYEKAYDHRGRAYEALAKDALALEDYTRCVTVSPAYADGYMNRGNYFNHRGELKRALDDYQKVIGLEPLNVRAINNIGTVYAKMSDNERALSEFDRAIGLDPGHAESYYNRSVIFKNKGQYAQALQDVLRSRALGADVEQDYIRELENASR